MTIAADPGAISAVVDRVTRELEERCKPSGRGIFLMRAFMDYVVFADGGREVQMLKRKIPER